MDLLKFENRQEDRSSLSIRSATKLKCQKTSHLKNSSNSPVKPIKKHLRKDCPPNHEVFFCDTNFFVAAIIDDKTDRHKAAVRFLDKLSKAKITLAFSTIVFSDVWNAILVSELSQALMEKNIHKAIKENPRLLQPHIPSIKRNYTTFLNLIAAALEETKLMNSMDCNFFRKDFSCLKTTGETIIFTS